MKHLGHLSSFLFISVWISAPLLAQQNKFDVGVEGGPGITKFYRDLLYSGLPDIAGSADITFQYNFPKIISIKTGLDYERKGWQGEEEFRDRSNLIKYFTFD